MDIGKYGQTVWINSVPKHRCNYVDPPVYTIHSHTTITVSICTYVVCYMKVCFYCFGNMLNQNIPAVDVCRLFYILV